MTEKQQRALYEQIGALVTQVTLLRIELDETRAKLAERTQDDPVPVDGETPGGR
jgi:hypothetical protein